MNAELSRLMDNLRIRLPGAVDTVLKLELFNTLKEFFSDSNSWYQDITFAVTPDVLSYELVPDGVCQVVRLFGAVNSDERPVNATWELPDTINLSGSPSKADTYTARLILSVLDPTTRDDYPVFPDWTLQAYGNEILDGVLGRMMSQAAKPYSNERLAIYHMRRFRAGVASARVDAQRKYTYRAQAWRFPQSFARRRAR